jgi:hypothetical protein
MTTKTKKRFSKAISVVTSVTTVVWMSGVTMLAPLTTHAAVTINDGDIFRASNDYKVYIAKYVGANKFKRWFVGPQMFDFYKHLSFAVVKVVDPSVAAGFTESKLVRTDGEQKVYYIGNAVAGQGADRQWIPTLDAFNAGGFGWDSVYVINAAEGNWYAMGANYNGAPTPSTSGGPVAGLVTASLATDNPAGAVLASGSLYNPMLKLTFWAPATGGATISGLAVTKYGLVANTDVNGLSVWDASGLRHGSVVSSLSSDNKATIGFGSDPITVPAGGSVTLTVKANLKSTATSGTAYFGLASAADVNANTTVGGAFPLVGNLFTLADGQYSLANVYVTMKTPGGNDASTDDGNVDVGDLQKEVADVQFSQVNSNEDIQVEQVVFYIEGDVTDAQLANWKLYDVAGNVLATVAKSVDRYATMNLTSPYVIPKGQNKTLTLKVDFVDGANRYMRVDIQNDYDMVIRGVSTRAAIQPKDSTGGTYADVTAETYGVNGFFKMRTGTISVSKATDSPSGNVTTGQTDALLAKFTVRPQGEDMELRRLTLQIVQANAVGGDDTTVVPNLTGNVSVRSADGALTYLTVAASDATVYSGKIIDLSTYLQLKSNVDSTLAVYGNIASTATSSASYQAQVKNFYVKRMSSIDYTTLQSAYVPANVLTVNTTDATVAKNSAVGAVTTPQGVAGVKIASFVVQGGTAEDARISSVRIGEAAGNLNTALTNLMLKVNGVQQGSTIATPVHGTNPFSVSVNLPKSTSVVFDVYADVKSDASGFTTNVVADGVTIIGLSTSQTIYRPATPSTETLQAVSIGAASLTITKDSSSPSEQVVTPANGVLLGNWKFAATNEDLKLAKVVFSVRNAANNGAGTAANFGTLYLKDGSTTLATAMMVGNDATFSWSPATVIPASGNKILSLYADLTGSGVQTPDTVVVWTIRSNASATYLDVQGSAGQLDADHINGGATTYFTPSNKFLYENSKLVIAAASDTPSGVKVPNSSTDLFKFTITNSGTRDISVTSVAVTINSSGLKATNKTAVKDWKLYDGSTLLASDVTEASWLTGTTTNEVVTFNASNDGSNAWFTDGNYVISAGASKTFTLKADTSGITTGIDAGASVYLTTKLDGTTGYGTSAWNNANAVGYTYTPSTGSEVKGLSVSDSYPVNSGTLQFTN